MAETRGVQQNFIRVVVIDGARRQVGRMLLVRQEVLLRARIGMQVRQQLRRGLGQFVHRQTILLNHCRVVRRCARLRQDHTLLNRAWDQVSRKLNGILW